jgi:hypothetical protein
VERAPRCVHIPCEIFRQIAENLQRHPGALLRLAVVCRSARDAVFKQSDAMWYNILEARERNFFRKLPKHRYDYGPAVIRQLPMGMYPNFKTIEGGKDVTGNPPLSWYMKKSEWPAFLSNVPFTAEETKALAQHSIAVARIESATHCGLCGAKHKLLQVWGLGMRVCSACMKDNLISGAALYHDYGINFHHHAERLQGTVYYFRCNLRVKELIKSLTRNPVDFSLENCSAVFFWKPHLQKVVDLDAARANIKCPARIAAAQKVSAAFRALYVRLFLAQISRSTSKICHGFHIAAEAQHRVKSGPYTLHPLSFAQRMQILEYLHKYPYKSMTCHEAEARTLFQQSYLGWRGNYKLPGVKRPESALEKLRDTEACRPEKLIKKMAPHVAGSSFAFQRWFDLKPTQPACLSGPV